MKDRDRYKLYGKYAEISAVSLLIGIFFLLVTVFVRYTFKQPIDEFSHLAFWMGFSSAYAVLSHFSPTGCSLLFRLRIFILNIIVLLSCCWIAMSSTDLSWDGMTVHQEMVIPLSCEWNPVLDRKFSEISEKSAVYPELKKGFVAFTPKIPYFLSATIIRATGHYESGKAITFIYIWISALISFSLLASFSIDRKYVWLLSLTIALNPVAVYQGFSYRLDGQVAALLGCLILAMLAIIFEGNWKQWLLFILSIILVSGTKISGLGYSLVFGCFLFVMKPIWGRRFKLLWILPVGGILVAVLGNYLGHFVGLWTISKENPYPYAERVIGALDKQTGHEDIDSMSRFSQFAESYFSPASLRRIADEGSQFYLGSNITNDFKLWSRTYNGFYQGGFGPFYGLTLVCFLLILIVEILFKRSSKETLLLLAVGLVVFLSSLLVPTYWARWTPQLWLLPCLCFFCILLDSERCFSTTKGKALFAVNIKTAGIACFFLLFFNSLFVCVGTVEGQRYGRSILNRQFDLISEHGHPAQTDISWIRAPRLWFDQHGIEYKNSNHNDIPPFMFLFHTDLKVRFLLNEDNSEEVLSSVRKIQDDIDFSLYKHWSKEILVLE